MPKMNFAAPPRRWDRIAWVSIAVGAVLRVIWGLFLDPPFDFIVSDMQGYVDRAQRLASGGPASRYDAFYPPGTHMLLALPMRVFGTDQAGLWAGAVLWCALSIAIPWLAWWLARQLLTPAAAALTAAFCAFSPLYITYGAYFSSEIPSLAFMIAALGVAVLATRADSREAAILALLAGLLGGVAVAIRPQWLLNLLIVGVVLLLTFRRRIAAMGSFALGVAVVLGLVVAYNSAAAQRLTGLSENGGSVFFTAHCDALSVTTNATGFGQNTYAGKTLRNYMTGPPPLHQQKRGTRYLFMDVWAGDQEFFYQLGWDCIKEDGARHLLWAAQNVTDMTVTSTPWPQSVRNGAQRDIVQAANLIYCVLLPWIVIEAVFLIRRQRRAGQPSGVAIMLAHLACLLPLALVAIGDPRYRSVYDVFGLALLAALLSDRFRLDRSAAAKPPSDAL